jgi:hypothetical protein
MLRVENFWLKYLATAGRWLIVLAAWNAIEWRDHIGVPPGGRVEFNVTGPPAGVPALLVTRTVDTGQGGENDPNRALASLIADSDAPEPHSKLAASGEPLPRIPTCRSIRRRSATCSIYSTFTIPGTAEAIGVARATPSHRQGGEHKLAALPSLRGSLHDSARCEKRRGQGARDLERPAHAAAQHPADPGDGASSLNVPRDYSASGRARAESSGEA